MPGHGQHLAPDFNPRSPCGERHVTLKQPCAMRNFNPRSPCGERLTNSRTAIMWTRFQSTLPLRGATRHAGQRSFRCRFQSTLPLRGATFCSSVRCPHQTISIHAPLAGSDGMEASNITNDVGFQSTLPLRGATPSENEARGKAYFNPRSPCGERRFATGGYVAGPDFNPRSPCGERQKRRGTPI